MVISTVLTIWRTTANYAWLFLQNKKKIKIIYRDILRVVTSRRNYVGGIAASTSSEENVENGERRVLHVGTRSDRRAWIKVRYRFIFPTSTFAASTRSLSATAPLQHSFNSRRNGYSRIRPQQSPKPGRGAWLEQPNVDRTLNTLSPIHPD